MLLTEREMLVPPSHNGSNLLRIFRDYTMANFGRDKVPVRFVVTKTDGAGYHCEIGVLEDTGRKDRAYESATEFLQVGSIFDFQQRPYESSAEFNVVFLVPTGIGAELGGHSGDAGAAARLLAGTCDNLITHPNVVNASDINELPGNALYVEGSVVTRLMMGTVGLQKVRSNRVMLVVDRHTDKMFHEMAVNSASAARASLGLDCPLVVVMNDRVSMKSMYSKSGRAAGRVENLERLCDVLEKHRGEYDAVALSTLIDVPEHYHREYFLRETKTLEAGGEMVNPWGGVEAMLTHAVSMLFEVPSAHAPMMTSRKEMELDVGVVDPRKAAEAVSLTYLHCVLKGLHRSPQIVSIDRDNFLISSGPVKHSRLAVTSTDVLAAANVSCLVVPQGCLGLPTLAALEQGIPVIEVRNKNIMKNHPGTLPFRPGKFLWADSYLEAAGLLVAMREGIAMDTVRRPMMDTTVMRAGRRG